VCTCYSPLVARIDQGNIFVKWWKFTIKQKNLDSCVLIDPDAFTHQIEYPIPVSFYEDMQHFWASVRMHGHKPFYYRSLKVGTQYQFAPPAEGGEFIGTERVTTKRERIGNYHYSLI